MLSGNGMGKLSVISVCLIFFFFFFFKSMIFILCLFLSNLHLMLNCQVNSSLLLKKKKNRHTFLSIKIGGLFIGFFQMCFAGEFLWGFFCYFGFFWFYVVAAVAVSLDIFNQGVCVLFWIFFFFCANLLPKRLFALEITLQANLIVFPLIF